MLSSISMDQFLSWLDFYNIEPWGFDTENYRTGLISACIYNSVRGNKEDKVWTPEDFFSFDKTEVKEKKQTSQEQYQIALTYAAIFNGKENKT